MRREKGNKTYVVFMKEELEEYILGHIDEEPEVLARIDHDTHVQNYYWHMCSGHL